MEGPCHVSQGLGIETEGEGADERVFQGRIVQQLVEERRPALVEGDGGAGVVLDFDEGRQAGLQGVAREDALGEAVERLDGGGVHLGQGGPAALALLRRELGLALGGLLQPQADAVAQLGRGGFGEGDGGYAPQLRSSGHDEP